MIPTTFPRPCLLTIACLMLAQPAAAQPVMLGMSRDELAKDSKLFITLASKVLKWEEPTEPVRIAGPIYFVGTRGLGAYLIVTSEGNILLNTGMPSSGPMIADSIRKLGFKLKDIKLLINCHAHLDHAGALAFMKEQTGAQVAIMREDVQAITDGGKHDFHYAADWKVMGFPPCKVDRVLRDEDTIKMGDVFLKAHHTPGHTQGTTTWVANIVHEGKALVVAWPDGTGVNPGYRVAKNPSYPGINADFRRTLHLLESLKPDIFLSGHTETFSFAERRKRAATEGVKAWINPEEYRRWVASRRRAFEEQVDLELNPPRAGALGQMAIDSHDAAISFHDARKEKGIYLVTLNIDKPKEAAGIKAGRVQVWLLSAGFDTIAPAMTLRAITLDGNLSKDPDQEVIQKTAVYSFQADHPRQALMAIVVAVDGEPRLFRLPSPGK